MKVKTADLSGVQLDYAVAVALGVKDSIKLRPFTNCPAYPQKYVWLDKGSSCFSPSSNWMACGPLIETGLISCYASINPEDETVYHWCAVKEVLIIASARDSLTAIRKLPSAAL